MWDFIRGAVDVAFFALVGGAIAVVTGVGLLGALVLLAENW
jgi:hypothetical protein